MKKWKIINEENLLKLLLGVVVCIFTTCSVANPVVENIGAGNVTIQQTSNSTVVNQSSQQAIINWQSFNIGKTESTHFAQPNGGVALNRINPQQGASQIYGRLTATGQIILVNPAGIYFGPGSYVNVGGLIATTADISDKNFLSGNYIFDKPSPYSDAMIQNQGTIIAAQQGLIALVGSNVSNTGYIQAEMGHIVLASGNTFTVSFAGNDMINFAVTDTTSKSGSVTNTGSLIANGGQILVSANQASNVLDNTIDLEGVVQAQSVQQQGGDIIISGNSNGGVVNVAASIDASGKHSGEKGGTVDITGYDILLNSPTVIDVSGDAGGGGVNIGGNLHGVGPLPNANAVVMAPGASINANAITNGNGGQVVLWSDNVTKAYGNISAEGGSESGSGGFIETSGKYLDVNGVFVNTSADQGETGTWLLDPANLTISTAATVNPATFTANYTADNNSNTSNVRTTDLTNALVTSDVVIQTTTGGIGTGVGDITVVDLITWTSNHSLTLTAANNININNTIDFSGSTSAVLNLNANTAVSGAIAINGAIKTGTSSASQLKLNATGAVTQNSSGIISGSGSVVQNGSGTVTFSQNNVYTGATTINSGTLKITSDAGLGTPPSPNPVAGQLTLNGGTLATTTTFTLDSNRGIALGTGGGTIAPVGQLTYNGIIDGPAGDPLNVGGTGQLFLGGTNTYQGATNVASGATLFPTASGAFGNSSGVIVASGGTLEATNSIVSTVPVTISGTGVGGEGAIFGINQGAFSDPITLAANSALGGNLTLSGSIIDNSNNYSVTKVDTGTLTLSGANSYGGGTFVNTGALFVNSATALGLTTGTVTVANGATLLIDGVSVGANPLIVSGTGSVFGAFGFDGGGSYAGNITLAGNATIAVVNTGNGTISGVISDGGNNYVLTTTMGGNSLILTNNNTYGGGTIITGSGATLQVGNGILTTGSLGTGNVTNGGSLVFDPGLAGSFNVTNNISGTGSVVQAGPGTVTLAPTAVGGNTYTGATFVNNGILAITADNDLGTAPSSFVAAQLTINNATLQTSGTFNLSTNRGITLLGGNGGTFNVSSGTLSVNNGSNVGGVIAGSKLTKTGNGTLNLDLDTNTYTGITTINAGKILISSDAGLGTVPSPAVANQLTLNGGTLSTNAVFTLNSNRGITLGINGGTLDGQSSGQITYNGAITNTSGSGLTFSGGDFFRIGGNSSTTFTGGTITINSGSTLSVTSAGALGAASNNVTVLSGATVEPQASVTLPQSFTINGNGFFNGSSFIGAILDNGSTVTISGDVILGSNSTIQVLSGPLTISGLLDGSSTLTKTGIDTLILSANNGSNFTGNINVNAGVLQANNAGALGTTAGQTTTVASGATLTINGVAIANEAVNLTGTGAIGFGGALIGIGTSSLGGAITLGAGGAAIGADIGGTLTLTGGITGSGQPLTIVGAGNTTISTNPIATGSGTLTMSGSGTLSLNTANTYTGNTTLNSGILNIGTSSNALGTSAGTFIINGGAVQFGVAATVANPFTVNSNVTFSGSAFSMNGTGSLSSGTLNITNTGTSGFTNNLSGAGNLTIANSSGGITVISGSDNSSYTGTTTINSGAILQIGVASNALGTGAVNLNGGNLQTSVANTTLTNNFTVSANSSIGAGNSNDLTFNLNGTGTLNTGKTLLVSANLNGNLSGAGNLQINTLEGATISSPDNSNFTGATTLSGGFLAINVATNALGTGVSATNTLALNGGTLQSLLTATLPNKFTVTNSPTINGSNNLTLSGIGTLNSGSTLTVTNTAITTLSGSSSGAGALTMNGSGGTLILSGANAYSGNTSVSAGTLQAGAANAFSASSAVTLANVASANLNLNNFSNSIKSLAGGGSTGGNVTLGSGTLTIVNAVNGSSTSYAGIISGTGGLTINLSGSSSPVQILSGANTYFGTTTITAGNLQAGAANTFSPNSAVLLSAVNVSSLSLVTFNNSILSLAGGGSGTTIGDVNLGSGILTIANAGSGSTSYAGDINGSGSLVVNLTGSSGTPTQVLSSINSSYTGGTTLNAGNLSISATNNLGNSTNQLTFNGGTLEITGSGFVMGRNIQINSNGGTIQTDAGATLTDGSPIAGSGNLSKTGTGELVLRVNSPSYSGNTTINAGTIQVQGINPLGNGSITVVSGGELALNAETALPNLLFLAGTGVANGGALSVPVSSSGVNQVNGITRLTGDTLISIGTGNTLVLNGATDGAFNLAFSGVGALTISGVIGGGTPLAGLSSSSSGSTTIEANVTTSGANGQIYNNPVTILNTSPTLISGAGPLTFESTLNGAGETLTIQNSSITTTGTVDFNSNVTLGGLSVPAGPFNVAFTGSNVVDVINNAVTLQNTGTVTLGNSTNDTLTFTNGVGTTAGTHPLSISIEGSLISSGVNFGATNVVLGGTTSITTGTGIISTNDLNSAGNAVSLNAASDITIFGNYTNGGNLTIANSSNGGTEILGSTDAGIVTLSNTTGVFIFFGNFTANSLVTANQNYSINFRGGTNIVRSNSQTNFLNTGNVEFQGTTTFVGGLATTGNASNPATTFINGSLQSNGANISLGNVTLIAPTSNIATTNTAPAGANLSIGNVTSSGHALILTAGTNGNITMGSDNDSSSASLSLNATGITVNGALKLASLSATGTGSNNSFTLDTGTSGFQNWTISANNSGSITDSTIASGSFSNIQNLTGGNENNYFTFTGTGTLSGTITGGGNLNTITNTIDYANYVAPVTVTLTANKFNGATTLGASAVNSYGNINNLVANTSDHSTLTFANTTQLSQAVVTDAATGTGFLGDPLNWTGFNSVAPPTPPVPPTPVGPVNPGSGVSSIIQQPMALANNDNGVWSAEVQSIEDIIDQMQSLYGLNNLKINLYDCCPVGHQLKHGESCQCLMIDHLQ